MANVRTHAGAVADHSVALAGVLAVILVDLVFLAAVAVMNWAAAKYVFEPIALDGVAQFALDVFEWSFTLSTLVVVVGYLAHDTIAAIRRPWSSGEMP